MPSPGLSLPPDAIRIEDEVWQEAFSRRERGRSRTASDAPTPPRRPSATARPAPPRRSAPPSHHPYAAPANGRRTVIITGRGAERHLPRPGDPGVRPVR